uniref:Probable oligoribonuclease n=1 Tax=Homalodisca liturata TaxID=320908 RepID=A0A1B6JX37_9HEMI
MMCTQFFRQLKTLLLIEINVKPHQCYKFLAMPANANSFGLTNSLRNMSLNNHPVPSVNGECTKTENNIVWVDMEMTGLDPEKDHVLEVACLVTDQDLNIVAEGPNLIIHQPPDILANMNEWSLKFHKESGLTDLSRNSNITLKEAEDALLEFVRTWTPYQLCPLGGNTVYMDRLFLRKYMPEFEQHMHYRLIDVSTVKELCRRWYPETYNEQPNKKSISKHRALDDIRNSIKELKFYRNKIFCNSESKKDLV